MAYSFSSKNKHGSSMRFSYWCGYYGLAPYTVNTNSKAFKLGVKEAKQHKENNQYVLPEFDSKGKLKDH